MSDCRQVLVVMVCPDFSVSYEYLKFCNFKEIEFVLFYGIDILALPCLAAVSLAC
jgi:hypothetical protein